MTDEEKNIIINHRIQKSKETIEEAEVLLKNKKLRAALNRIYYAIFYITSALALKHGSTGFLVKRVLNCHGRKELQF